MISVLIGNLFESKASTIVNTVNCTGVMGKGIALEFKKRFPGMFQEYIKRCELGQVQLGKPYLYKDLNGISIVNFPTKEHWRSPSKLEDIKNGLDEFINKYKEWNIKSIAFPPLGCGNGGLDWTIVGPIIYQKLSQLSIPVEIYAPYGTSAYLLSKDYLSKKISADLMLGRKFKKMQPAWVLLLEIVNALEHKSYANPVGRTIFQKICYVLTELKVDTGFTFQPSNYGPFSSDIKEVLSIFANANLIYEQQMGRMTALKIGSEYKNIRSDFIETIQYHQKEINKTVDLFSRIKSTDQAEEVATVLYAARNLKKKKLNETVSEQELFDYILNWKKKWNKQEKKQTVASTIRNLEILNWLKLQYSESLPQVDI